MEATLFPFSCPVPVLSFRAMMDPGFSNPTPQFGTVEYVGSPGGDRCQFCHQLIGGNYYRVNGAMACSGCADKMRYELAKDTHSAYVRAMLFGIGAAILGLVGYAVVSIILQGWVISYMSFGVGWLVGVAMMKGSGGIGGRRYQIAAVLLTYAAVSMAAIPIWIYFANQHRPKQTEQQRQEAQPQQSDNESERRQQEPAAARSRPSLGAWLARVAVLGLASPFLELQGNLFWGAMGLVILFVGIKIAWRLTAGRPMEIFGPFHDSAQSAH